MTAPQSNRFGFRAWLTYSVTALVVTGFLALLITRFLGAADSRAVWFSALLACGLQWPAFAGLIWFRNQAHLFMAGWLIGMVLRFGALGGVAWWLSRSAALPREATLLSLVGFVFVLLILEPIFLRWDLRKA